MRMEENQCLHYCGQDKGCLGEESIVFLDAEKFVFLRRLKSLHKLTAWRSLVTLMRMVSMEWNSAERKWKSEVINTSEKCVR